MAPFGNFRSPAPSRLASQERLAAAQQRLQAPKRLEAIAADVTQEAQVVRLCREIGRADHVVSAAADIAGAYRLLPELDIAAARNVIDSKLVGPLLLAKYVSP